MDKKDNYGINSIVSSYKKRLSEFGYNNGFDDHSMKMFRGSIDATMINASIHSMKDYAISLVQEIYGDDDADKKKELQEYFNIIEEKPVIFYKTGDVTPITGRTDVFGANASTVINKLYDAFNNGIILGLETQGYKISKKSEGIESKVN